MSAVLRTACRRVTGTAAALAAVAAIATACGGHGHGSPPASTRLAAVARAPAAPVAVLAGPSDAVAAGVAERLFSAAPVVVLADATSQADLSAAAAIATRLHVPLLLAAPEAPVRTAAQSGAAEAGPAVAVGTAVRAEIAALGPRAVLAVGLARKAVAAQLLGVQVVTAITRLPKVTAPAPVPGVVLLTSDSDHDAAGEAAAATARAAGAAVIGVRGYDPRADATAITALAAARPRHVVAVGGRFGPVPRLTARLAVAETGVQLPDGGQVLFPAHRLVALYGYPGTPALGALGEQGLAESIARVRRLAAEYRPLSTVPVVPAFEILATVAQGSPGPQGTYSYESPIAALRPWVSRATAAGMYVVLDLQAGRASLLAQAEHYRSLLRLPDVGLALDPEWKLGPGELPLHQIGSVSIAEVNSVSAWLAALTARYHLPQKLLVLHQFRLSMITGEQALDTRHDDLAIVIHMDGQGTPSDKLQTWDAVTGAAPRGVYFGWKDFFVKDHPMLTPRQTMANRPQPVMISYE